MFQLQFSRNEMMAFIICDKTILFSARHRRHNAVS